MRHLIQRLGFYLVALLGLRDPQFLHPAPCARRSRGGAACPDARPHLAGGATRAGDSIWHHQGSALHPIPAIPQQPAAWQSRHLVRQLPSRSPTSLPAICPGHWCWSASRSSSALLSAPSWAWPSPGGAAPRRIPSSCPPLPSSPPFPTSGSRSPWSSSLGYTLELASLQRWIRHLLLYSRAGISAFFLSAARYAILPAFTIVVGSIAGWMLGMRNTMITTLSEDYVLMAEAKGPHRAGA